MKILLATLLSIPRSGLPHTDQRTGSAVLPGSIPTEFSCQGAQSLAPALWQPRVLIAAHRRRPAFCRGEAAVLKIGERIAITQGKRSALIAAELVAAHNFYDHQTHHLDSRGSLRSSYRRRCLVRIFRTESGAAGFRAGYDPSGQWVDESRVFYARGRVFGRHRDHDPGRSRRQFRNRA